MACATSKNACSPQHAPQAAPAGWGQLETSTRSTTVGGVAFTRASQKAPGDRSDDGPPAILQLSART